MKGCGACGSAPGAAPRSAVLFRHSKLVAMSVAFTAPPRSAARTRATFHIGRPAASISNRAKYRTRRNARDARNSYAGVYADVVEAGPIAIGDVVAVKV